MKHTFRGLALVGLAVAAAGCGERITSSSFGAAQLSNAFTTVPVGFDNVTSTFNGSVPGQAWGPRADMGGPGGFGFDHDGGMGMMDGGRRHGGAMGGPMGGPMDGGLMGSGLGPMFMGGGFGADFGHDRFGDRHIEGSCAFNAATGRVECAPEVHDSLTILRSIAFADASGAVQSAFDSLTTNTINTRISVIGSFVHRNGARSAVQNASDRTVSGLAQGSTQRTVNGTATALETTTGQDTAGAAFTVVRTVGDTTSNVVIPVPTTLGQPVFPTSGTIIRAMSVSLTAASGNASSSRREVITYNGTSTATLVITQDGVTRNCTVSLPRGRPVCQ